MIVQTIHFLKTIKHPRFEDYDIKYRYGNRFAYLGNGDTFDRAIARFATAYADQNEKDYAELKAAADSGRIEVVSGY